MRRPDEYPPRFVTSITRQGSGVMNEDRLMIDEAHGRFGVFDGASSLVKYQAEDGRTGGRLAADIALAMFMENPKEDLSTLALAANAAIRQAEIAAGIDISQKEALWGTTATVVNLNPKTFDWLTIGNSTMLVAHTDGRCETLGLDDDHDLPTLLMWQELAAQKATDPWKTLADQNVKVRREVNETYGYLNGEPQAAKFIRSGQVALKGVHAILILSDGLEKPKVDPNAPHDWNGFINLWQSGGLAHVYEYVRRLENSDPDAWRYPRLKRHDDASGVALLFDPHH